MTTISQFGQSGGCCSGSPGGGYPIAPLVYDPSTGGFKAVIMTKVDGVSVPSLVDPSPKVQDDDDLLWRHIYWEDIGGGPVTYVSDTADDVPGYPLIAYNSDSGKLEMAHTRKVDGIVVMYWLPLS